MKRSHWIILILLLIVVISISSIFYFTTNNSISSKDMENIKLDMTTSQISEELGTPYKKIKTSSEVKDIIQSLKDDPLSNYVTEDIDELIFNFENSSESEVFIYKAKNNDEDYKLFFIDNKLAYF